MNKKKGGPTKTHPHNPKYIIALECLASRPMIELEALNLYGDTCLHSTISYLANEKGIEFDRVPEPHTHRNRGLVHFTRYKLKESSRLKALCLLRLFGVEVEV